MANDKAEKKEHKDDSVIYEASIVDVYNVLVEIRDLLSKW